MWPRREQFLCGVVEGFYGRPWLTSQRVELFDRMSEWGMNTYLYAPKDDDKHRSSWRDLYTLEEADQLSQLILQASSRGIVFIYAIAPGLDMTFSSGKELEMLKRKLDQVSALGCNSFAILFDDIDPDLCPADDKIFPSFAHAQVATANDLFCHLDRPKVFLFCPTEYCASRAVPTVTTSQYLQHIGKELDSGIDIMWTGPKVISKTISLNSIEELSSVLHRPPVLWDNLHANDYDQRRLFLGPYSGRSVSLRSHLNGVLTNPNCEFTANYIAISTLAQWNRSALELGKKSLPTRQAFQLEVEGETNDYDPSSLPPVDEGLGGVVVKQGVGGSCGIGGGGGGGREKVGGGIEGHLYEPRKALEVAMKGWMEEIKKTVSQSQNGQNYYHPVKDASSIAKANEFEELGPQNRDGIGEPDDPDSKPGLVDPELDPKLNESGTAMLVSKELFETEDLRLLVDFFYLPHQHGDTAVKILEEFCWLKERSPGYEGLRAVGKIREAGRGGGGGGGGPEEGEEGDREGGGGGVMCDRVSEDGMRSDGETSDRAEDDPISTQEVLEWCERCQAFHILCQMVKDMYNRLTTIPNRPLLYDVYQYMWDAKETTILLDSYISWLETGGNEVDPGHEPYLPRGGITGEMQDLLPRMKMSKSVYGRGHTPKSPIPESYTIRPYRSEDQEMVYKVCLETGNAGRDATHLFSNFPDLLGDRFVGPYTHLSPDLSFVLEDGEGVCGYVLAALDSKSFYDRYTSEWLPRLEGKYPPPPPPTPTPSSPSSDASASSEIEMLREVTVPNFYLPPSLYLEHPSHLHIDLLPRAQGRGMGTSMIKTILAILKAKGSKGVHLEMNANNKRALKFYLKRGFSLLEFEPDATPPNDVIILGQRL